MARRSIDLCLKRMKLCRFTGIWYNSPTRGGGAGESGEWSPSPTYLVADFRRRACRQHKRPTVLIYGMWNCFHSIFIRNTILPSPASHKQSLMVRKSHFMHPPPSPKYKSNKQKPSPPHLPPAINKYMLSICIKQKVTYLYLSHIYLISTYSAERVWHKSLVWEGMMLAIFRQPTICHSDKLHRNH